MKDILSAPAYPPSVDENGWVNTGNTGFNKLEAATLKIATGILSMGDEWNCMFSTKELIDGRTKQLFDSEKVSRLSIKLAKTILANCKKELENEETTT